MYVYIYTYICIHLYMICVCISALRNTHRPSKVIIAVPPLVDHQDISWWQTRRSSAGDLLSKNYLKTFRMKMKMKLKQMPGNREVDHGQERRREGEAEGLPCAAVSAVLEVFNIYVYANADLYAYISIRICICTCIYRSICICSICIRIRIRICICYLLSIIFCYAC